MDNRASRHLGSIERTLKVAVVGAVIMLAVWLLGDILLLVFTAVLIASVLRGASNTIHRATGLSQGFSLLAVIIAIFVVFGTLLWWRGAAIGEQAVQMSEQLTIQAQKLWEQMEASSWGSLVARQLRSAAQTLGTNITGYVRGFASSVLGIGGSLVVAVATALFLATSPQMYVSGTLRLLPVPWRPRARDIGHKIGATLQLWFLGQLADMFVVSVLIGAGLFLLDVPLATTLALFAGLLNFVPYVGALAGAVPAILVAFATSSTLALWVALLFGAVQILEGNVIAPLIQQRTISLPPALTLLAQTILGTLFGVFGLIVATPLVAVVLVAVRMIYIEDVLESGSGTSGRAS